MSDELFSTDGLMDRIEEEARERLNECDWCNGTGGSLNEQCGACRGTGRRLPDDDGVAAHVSPRDRMIHIGGDEALLPPCVRSATLEYAINAKATMQAVFVDGYTIDVDSDLFLRAPNPARALVRILDHVWIQRTKRQRVNQALSPNARSVGIEVNPPLPAEVDTDKLARQLAEFDIDAGYGPDDFGGSDYE